MGDELLLPAVDQQMECPAISSLGRSHQIFV
jgi:hypothetical protein